MDMKEAMSARHTVRVFEDKPVDAALSGQLRARMERNNETYGTRMTMRLGDTAAFGPASSWPDGKGSLDYVILSGPEGPDAERTIGYAGADLMLYAQTIGLNTWWVAGTCDMVKVREEAAGAVTVGVLAFGKGLTQGVPHPSKSPADVAVWEGAGPAPAWFDAGVKAALLAPTGMNRQAFRLHGSDGAVRYETTEAGPCAGVDEGIVRCHFELGAGKDAFHWAPDATE